MAAPRPEDVEVAVGDPGDRADRDRRAPLVELADEPLEDVAELLVLAEREPAVTDELRVAAACAKGRGQPARERLEERVGARIVVARGEVDVLRAQERREPWESRGPTVRTCSNVAGARPANVSS